MLDVVAVAVADPEEKSLMYLDGQQQKTCVRRKQVLSALLVVFVASFNA